MGGGVVYNVLVVRPGLFRAAVAYAPVSSDTVDNFDKWVRRDTSRTGAARAVIGRLGTPEADPAAWAATSPRTYFGRITEPLLIHHGTADEDCPIAWSRESVAALRAKGKSVELDVYPGGRHTLTSPQWDTSIRRTEAFLAKHLT
jgi:dipeptidyl aminopeptidase/acylaminoacyl peptidase